MVSRSFDKMPLSRGEKASIWAYAIVSIFCAAIAFWMVSILSDVAMTLRLPTLYELWAMSSGAVGALTALYLCRNWMGNLGWIGFLRAIVGTVLIGVIAAVVAGSLLLPVYGTMFGPFLLLSQLLVSPHVAAIWIAVLLSIHGMLVIGTLERDTIFRTGTMQR